MTDDEQLAMIEHLKDEQEYTNVEDPRVQEALEVNDLTEDLKIDTEVSIIQSLLGTNIMRAMRLTGGQDVSEHIERFLNVTLHHLGYNAKVNRSKLE